MKKIARAAQWFSSFLLWPRELGRQVLVQAARHADAPQGVPDLASHARVRAGHGCHPAIL
jgi:hypothetical protein